MGKRYEKIADLQCSIDGKGLRIGIVMSRFNIDICEGLLGACVAELGKRGVSQEDAVIIEVAGALEIPLTLKKMAQTGKYDALIALGAVVRGDTYHFEVVSNESARGITDVQLQTGIPVANGVLTTDTDAQALQRMTEKGRDAAMVAVEMANLVKCI